LRLALIVDRIEWHSQGLVGAFADRGAEAVPVRLASCAFDTTARFGVVIPGFAPALPDAVMVRAVGGGSFEEVTRRLGILHGFRELGVPVWNDARAIERCVDKSMASFLLARAGLPTPPTWVVEGIDAAREVVARESGGGKLVQKPLFGAQGRGLTLIATPEDLPAPEAVGRIYYLQRYVPAGSEGFQDYRLLVCRGEVVAAMTRRSAQWITNIGRGGRPEPVAPDAALSSLALRAAECIGADYAGVDLMRDAEGRLLVLEVNSMPGWRGLQQVSGFSIAQRIAASLLQAVAGKG
jgi:tetrahydromethanopterin:alpha-L-glutamate ligase